MKVQVLGTEYTIRVIDRTKDSNLERMDGYCDHSAKKIVIDTFQKMQGALENMEVYKKRVIRHELVHAFLFESGLTEESWARNEEIVDWIAYQFPKLLEAFKKVGAL